MFLLLLKGLDPDAPIMLCRERVSAAVAAAPDKEAGKKVESEERLKVFNEICNKDVAADILTRYVHGVVKVSSHCVFLCLAHPSASLISTFR